MGFKRGRHYRKRTRSIELRHYFIENEISTAGKRAPYRKASERQAAKRSIISTLVEASKQD